MHRLKYWILWLLLWQVASCTAGSAVLCGPTAVDATVGPAVKSAGIIVNDQRAPGDRAFGPSLHAYIYNGDFIGFTKQINALSRHENFPSLLGALQAGDDRGMTVVHLLACAGRHDELSDVVDVLFRMQGEGVEMIRRIVLESRNQDACRGKNCDLPSDRPGLYAHGTLQFRDPAQQVVLFGNVTPLECAAAHGHVQAMKRLIQCGVEAGRAFEIAKIFSLTDRLHQAIQLANTEGFLAQPKVFLPLSSKSAKQPQRQCIVPDSSSADEANSGGSSSQSSVTGKHKEKGSSGRLKGRSKQSSSEGAEAAAAVLMAVSGAADAGSTPSSTSAASSDLGTSTNGSKSTKLAEMLDVAALLLLTGMLLLPLWSTMCLLWRRAVRRRAAITEPARKIKEALFSATLGSALRTRSSTSSNESSGVVSSGGSVSSAAEGSSNVRSLNGVPATAAGNKKGRAASSSSTRQRKAPVNQQTINSTTTAVPKAKVSIPVMVSCEDSDQPPAESVSRQQRQHTPDVVAKEPPSLESVVPRGPPRSNSDPGTAAPNTVLPQSSTACDASSRSKASTAPIARSTSDVVKSVYVRSNKRNKQQQPAGAVGSSPGASSATTACAQGPMHNSTSHVSDCPADANNRSDLSIAGAQQQQQAMAAVKASPVSTANEHVVPSSFKPSSRAADNASSDDTSGLNRSAIPPAQAASKRRVAGSRSVAATSATAAKLHRDVSQGSTALSQQVKPASRSGKQQADRDVSPAKAPNSRQRRAAKSLKQHAEAAAAAGGGVNLIRSRKGGLSAAQRTASAGPTSGVYDPVLIPPKELRALSADDAAQAAKAYAALITPYKPSVSAAGARPAIYQPPSALGGSSSSKSNSESCDGADSDVCAQRKMQHGGMSAVGSKQQQQQSLKASQVSDNDMDDLKSCKRDQDLCAGLTAADEAADVSPYATALHIPADTITLGSSAELAGTPPSLTVCFSSPAALVHEHSMGTLSSSSSSLKERPSLQSQPSGSYCFGPLYSEGSVPEPHRDAYVSSSSSSTCSAAAAVCGSYRASDAASVISESSTVSSGSPTGSSAAVATQLPPPPPLTPSTAATRPVIAAADDRSGALSPVMDEELVLPPAARAASGIIEHMREEGSVPVPYAAAAAASSGSSQDQPGAVSAQLLSGSSPSTGFAEQHPAAVADTSAADAVGNWSDGSAAAHSAAAVVLGSADAEIAFQPRGNVSGPVSTSSALSEHMSFMATAAPQQQQQMAAGPSSIQAIAQTLLQHSMPGASEPQAVEVTPEAVAQMASRWQQQQQQQVVARAQQQRLMTSMPQSAGWHEQQAAQQAAQQVLRVPATAMNGGMQQVQLPAGMMALLQASKNQAAAQQQQHVQLQSVPQQQQQQQKLMLFVPQQSGVQLVSPTGSFTSVSPQQRAVVLSPAAGVPAMQVMQQQQQQQQAAISAAPYAQQVAYLQQQQQQQQLQNVLQGGAVRVVYSSAGRLQLQPQAGATSVAQGLSHIYTSASNGMSAPAASAYMPGHRYATAAGGLTSPSGPQQQQHLMTATSAPVTLLSPGHTAAAGSASQQLLAMMQPSQVGMQQTVHGGHSPSRFDWSGLASELTTGRGGSRADGGGSAEGAVDQSGLLRALAASGNAAGMNTAAGGGADRTQLPRQLSVMVPEGGPGNDQHNESARMAAELDELLHQANQQLGWSGIPQTSDDSARVADASPAQTAASTLKADAAEYQPHGVPSTVLTDGACGGGISSSGEGKNVRLKNLEALQLPDGFCSGD